MRSFAWLALALMVPACFGDGYDVGDDARPPPAPPPPGPCAGRDCTPADDFHFTEPGAQVGVGLELTVEHDDPQSLAHYDLTSSDPSVVEVDVIGEQIVIHPHQAGMAAVVVRKAGDPRIVAQYTVTAIDVATVALGVRTRPVVPAPITTLAAVIGSDTIAVEYRSAAAEPLAGHAAFSVRGDVLTLEPATTESRLSELFESRDRVRLGFVGRGTGELVVTIDGGIEHTLPIEVVAAPATLATVAMVLRDGELVRAPDAVEVGEPVGVDVIGRTADGRFVAGVVADWTTSGTLWTPRLGVSELVFDAGAPGPVDVTARVGDLTITQHLQAR
jgi:hypothetical protein